ncbi:MAG: glycosyltransferase family 2 protein [Acidimicrobiales bacterium]
MVSALQHFDLVGGSFDTASLNGFAQGWRPRPARADAGRPQPFTSGANLGIRRAVFNYLGGFRVGFRYAGKDADLCWRAQQAGYTLGYVPDAVLQYRFRRRLTDPVTQQFRYGRSAAELAKVFPELDHPVRVGFFREVAWLGFHSKLVLSRETGGAWLRSAAYWSGGWIEQKSTTGGVPRLDPSSAEPDDRAPLMNFSSTSSTSMSRVRRIRRLRRGLQALSDTRQALLSG